MATIRRIRVLWGGIPGMPGYSLFYASAAADATADLVTYFNAIKARFPSGLSWTVPPTGDTLDDATGTLNGSWSGAGAGIVTSTGTGAYAAGVGAYSAWVTNAIVGGRRLRGRTFLAPLLGTNYDNTGTIDPTQLTTFATATSTLAATGKLVVWHRPSGPGASNGSSSLITAGVVPDVVTSLRSRRF